MKPNVCIIYNKVNLVRERHKGRMLNKCGLITFVLLSLPLVKRINC